MIQISRTRRTTSLTITLVCVISGGLFSGDTTAFDVPLPEEIDDSVCNGPLATYFCTTWTARYDGPVGGNDIAGAIAVGPHGDRVYVTGYSKVSGDSNAGYATIAYDSLTGQELWVAFYNPGWGVDIPHAITVGPEGDKVYVTGESRYAMNNPDRHYATIAYDATDGRELWVAELHGSGSGHDIAHAIGVSPDGTMVFVTGESSGEGTFKDYATAAYDTADGTELWVARYDGPIGANDIATSLGVSPNGSLIFVTGSSARSGTGLDYTTIAYEAATGIMQWLTHYDGPANGVDIATGLVVSADGGHVYITGHSVGVGTGADYATIKYDAMNGSPVWVARYNGPANGFDLAKSLVLSPDAARLYVTGASPGIGTGKDYATIAYNATTGDTFWITRYDGEGNDRDEANAIGVSPDGTRVFVTGESHGDGTGYTDSLTIAYDSTDGTEIWTARAYEVFGLAELGHLAYDASNALAVHPHGTMVYVTGHTWSQADYSGYNWQTIAYGAVTPPSITLPPNPPNLPLPHLPIPEPPGV